jgi:hypothetical protein
MMLKKLRGQVSVRSLQKGIWIALLALIVWSFLFFALDELSWRIPWSYWQETRQIIPRSATVTTFLLILLAFLATPTLASLFRRWNVRREVSNFDLFLFSFATFCGATALAASAWWIAPSATIFALLALRAGIAPRPRSKPSSEGIFDEVLGQNGLAPLVDFSQDELERGTLLEAFLKLIEERRLISLTFGLEGSWGSGKTSLLVGLRKALESKGYSVLSLSIWNYREPEKILRAYFDSLEQHLKSRLALSNLKRNFYRVAAGLADIAPSDILSKLGKLLPGSPDAPVEDLRKELECALTQLDRPIVILLDDLDRLEADELKAVIRAIRLFGDLPNLTHVIAYDREQLSKTLFPDDEDGNRARDYLGKVINTEISIGSPPAELLAKLLDRNLGPLLRAVGEETAQRFVRDIQHYPLTQILEALPTPREIRRVAAATAWIWDQIGKHLNLFDLFVLTAIQYRFPKIYWTMRAHPEWFTAVDWWTENPQAFFLREEWGKERKKYFDNLTMAGSRENRIAFTLLKMLLPGIAEEDSIIHPSPSEKDARKERRLIHPLIFGRYFHLYLAPSLITEFEIEDFAEQIRTTQEGLERQNLITQRIILEARQHRIESFWNQWDLVFTANDAQEAALTKDLALGIARAAHELSDKFGFFRTSDRRTGIFKIARLVSSLSNDHEATTVLEEVIMEATSTEVSAYLVNMSRKADTKNIFGELRPQVNRLEQVLNDRVRKFFLDTEQSLLSAPKSELQPIVLWVWDHALISELVIRGLERNPELLPRLLEVVAPERTDESENKILVEQFNPSDLTGLIPVEEVFELTAKLDLTYWADLDDRELVRRFREWMTQVRQGQGATAAPPPPAAPPSPDRSAGP